MVNRANPEFIFNGEGIRWESYNPKDVGMRLITQHQDNTGAILGETFPNTELRSQANEAWGGSRQSRAPGDIVDIFQEVVDKNVNADGRLDSTFKSYGHASVADMASIAIHFANVPMHLPMNLFNVGVVNSGQEKSTRYQKQFSGAVLHPLKMYLENVPEHLEKKYQDLGRLSIENFTNQKLVVTKAYEDFYKPSEKSHASALESRVLDTVRFNLLLGQSTGFVYKTSARDWAKIISQLKASELKYYNDVGQQIETFLSPSEEIENALSFKAEAPSLIKYTKADNTIKNNLIAIQKYISDNGWEEFIKYNTLNSPSNHNQSVELLHGSSDEKMLLQYVLAAYPAADFTGVSYALSRGGDSILFDLSKIIFAGHSKYNEMPQQLATTEDLTLAFNGTLGELRDFNRHRAWGRFMQDIPLFNGPKVSLETIDRIINKGYGLPSYVADVSEFKDLKNMMVEGLDSYYSKVSDFKNDIIKEYGKDNDYHFMINTLPLAHRSDILMHGNPKQAHYMTNLRIKPGGHINYRQLAFDAVELIKNSSPIYSAIMTDGVKRPDASSRSEFFDRS